MHMDFESTPEMRQKKSIVPNNDRFQVQACPGATECIYKIVFTFYGIEFPPPHFGMPGLGQGFKPALVRRVVSLK